VDVTPSRFADEKFGWRHAGDRRAPYVATVHELLEPWLRGRRVTTVELMAGGLMNRNCRVGIHGAPADVVLRLNDRDREAAAKEIAVLRTIGRSVPVPEILYADADPASPHPPFAVMALVDGLALSDLKRTGDRTAIDDAAYDAGRVLAGLQAFGFDRPGLLTPDLTVDTTSLPDPLTTATLVEIFSRAETFKERAGAALVERLLRVAREWTDHPTAPPAATTLVHGDFNSRNVLVSGATGRWRVAAVLDWEFAFAGPIDCDIGNFLRYEHPERPRFEPAFSHGLRDAGIALEGEWRRAARMADLPALCELVSRDSTPPDVVAELLALVARTLT